MKKIYSITTMSFLLLFKVVSYAQNPPVAHLVLDINDVSARINAVGNHFRAFADSGSLYEVPKNSGKHTIYANTFWIGGVDRQNTLYLSAERYRQVGSDYTTGPLKTDGTASTDSVTINNWNRLWIVDRSDIDQLIQWHNNPSAYPGYIIPNSVLEWPAHGNFLLGQSHDLAPFVDVNNDGQYTPSLGDYPLIRGDRAIFFIFNDSGLNSESHGTPLGIEVQAMAYAFNCPSDDAFNHTIFMNYKIINRSIKNYHYVYLGLFTDLDIGYHLDDLIGCDVARGSYFGYNGDPMDGDTSSYTYGALPPAQAVTILAGPYMNPDGMDNPEYDYNGNQNCDVSINGLNFGDTIIDNERLGMTGFTYFNNSTAGAPPYMKDPEIAAEYYYYLKGLWKDGTPMMYGGNGHSSAGAYGPECNFMFPGNSDTCNWGTEGIPPNGPVYWTESISGNQPNDRRGLGVTGPFTFETGATQELDFAFVYGRTTDSTISSVDVMKANIDVVRNAFATNLSPCGGPIYAAIKEVNAKPDLNLSIFPNPAQSLLEIEFSLQKPSPVRIDIYDMLAKNCMTYKYDEVYAGKSNIKLDISPLKQGIYFVNVSIGKYREQKKLVVIK